MATDSTQVNQAGTIRDEASANGSADGNPEIVQLAQAGNSPTGGTTVHVDLPVGQTLVRVPVTPGEVIDLPFDGDLSARLGEQGNLAIKLGDRTIILENYAGANQQEGVVLKDSAGHEIDVASVIAQTDPSLDIQTAAGPAAAAGTPGSGFFSPFGDASGLGGLGELDVLAGTELQYGLINPDERDFLTFNRGNDGTGNTGTGGPGTVNPGTDVPVLPEMTTLVVNERNLPDGTCPNEGALTVSGEFKLPDGYTLSPGMEGIHELPNGTLTISVKDGVVTYTYHLDSAYHNDPANDGRQTIEDANHFDIGLDGPAGGHMTVPVRVDIIDDVPVAADDHFEAGTAQVEPGLAIGNVLENDKAGADGYGKQKIVDVEGGTKQADGSWVIETENGTIHISADGQVTFDAKGGVNYGSGTEFHFNYTIADSDGDQSSASVDFTVKNPAGPGQVEISPLVVNEANLTEGTAPDADALTTSGSFKLPDGYTLAPGMEGEHQLDNGTLTISVENGVVTYTYHLDSAFKNDPANDGAQTIENANHFDISLEGPFGGQMTVPVRVDIVDDRPIASDDHFETVAAQAEPGLVIGNVLENDKAGADGYGTQKIVDVEGGTKQADGSWVIETENGTIHISADGQVTFDAKDGVNYGAGTEFHFTYTIADADGDQSSATADFTVKNPAGPGQVETSPLVVNEANLTEGTSPDADALTTSGSFKLPDGYTLAPGMEGEHQLDNGTLTISVENGVVTYTYHLDSAFKNDPKNDGVQTIEDANHFDISLEGPFGGQITVPVRVDIIDDRPIASDDHFGQKTAGTAQGQDIGNILANDKAGADGYGSQKIVDVENGTKQADGSWVIETPKGTIHISADGQVTFDAKAGVNYGKGTEFHFTYTIADGDGDQSSATADFTVKNPATPGVPETTPLTVNEANLADGTSPNPGALEVKGQFALPEGYTLATGMLGTHALDNGTLTISVKDGVVTYTYHLDSAYHNDPKNDGAQTIHDANHFEIGLDGPFGGHITVPVRVDIIDDKPVAVDDHFGTKTAQLGDGQVIGNVLANDKAGADGYGSQKIVDVEGGTKQADGSWVIETPKGTIHVSANGDVTFDAKPGYSYGSGTAFDFTYTIEDGDGDRASAKADFTVQNPGAPEVPSVPHLVVDEGNLATGTHPNSGALTTGGSFTLPAGCSLAPGMAGVHQLDNGTLTISVKDGVVSYTYHLTSAYHNTPKDDGVQTIENANHFDIALKGPQGQDLKVPVAIDIKDDAPQAKDDNVSVNTNSPAYNLLFVIDTSGSMKDPSGVGNLTRLQLEQQALVQMLQSFAASGVPIRIQIVDFNTSATTSKVFTSISDAENYINGLKAGGNTNYDAAVAKAEASTVFNNAVPGSTNLVYFVSDGKPNEPKGSVGLNASELSDWRDFLNTHDATAISVGIGKGDIDYSQLNGIATNGKAIHAEDPNTLVTDLTSVLPGSVSGNVLANDLFGADGGAGVYQLKLTYNGTVVTFDQDSAVAGHVLAKTGHTLTIGTAEGGKLVFNFDTGDYTYIPPVSSTHKSEDITYVIKDGDGDTSSAHLHIDVNATTHVTVPYTPDYHHATSQSGAHVIDGVIYNDVIGKDNKADKLSGSDSSHNWIDGKGGDDTLTAGKNGDVLIGGAGHDKFIGGAGNDTIVIDKDDLYNNNKLIAGSIVDGKGGYNRLVFDFDLDTTKLNNNKGDGKNTLNHLDILDMNDGNHQELVLSKESVSAMLNHDKTLFVQADSQDTVKLLASDNWQNSGTAVGNDGHTYIHFTSGTGSNAIHLYVDHEASVVLG